MSLFLEIGSEGARGTGERERTRLPDALRCLAPSPIKAKDPSRTAHRAHDLDTTRTRSYYRTLRPPSNHPRNGGLKGYFLIQHRLDRKAPLNPSEVTRLLQAEELNQPELIDRLVPLLYEELRTVAHRYLQGERSDHTLNTTALVHEAYLRVADLEEMTWNDRVHFMATAARMMRRILIDYARRRNAEKRGAGLEPEPLEEDWQLPEGRRDGLELADLISLDQALERLNELDQRQASVLELRHFGGLQLEEIATAVDISLATVKRDLAAARAWLARRLRDQTNV